MSRAPFEPGQPRVLPGEARFQGRRWESLRAALRRGAFGTVRGNARAYGTLTRDVLVRARLSADGIRELYCLAERLRGRIPGADRTATGVVGFAQALVRVAGGHPPGGDRGALLERVILTEGRPLGAAVLTLEVEGVALLVALRTPRGEAIAVGAEIRLVLARGSPLTAAHSGRGARFEAALAAFRERDWTGLEIGFEPWGSLHVEPAEDRSGRTGFL